MSARQLLKSGDVPKFAVRTICSISAVGKRALRKSTYVCSVSPAPAFCSGARCRRAQVLIGRKSNETKTWNVARNVGNVYWAGGRARCRELTASRQPGDRRERREFRRIFRHRLDGLPGSEFCNRRSATNGLEELYPDR